VNQVIQTLKFILEIESVSGHELGLCDWVQSEISSRSKGLVSQKRVGNSILALGPHEANRPTIILAGHLDTVPLPSSYLGVRELEGKIYGTGASDMKAGVAVMLELLHANFLEKSNTNLVFVFYEKEEGPFEQNGIHKIMEMLPEFKHANLCFLLEPTNNTLQFGCVGVINSLVRFHGKRAHSARPWHGENAIQKAAPFINAVIENSIKSVLIDGLEFKDTLAITQACSGDNALNVIPDVFEININQRFSPQTSVEAAKELIIKLLAGRGSLEFRDIAPSAKVVQQNPLVTNLAQTFSLKREPKQAYTDVAVFSLHGIDAINFGPGLTEKAHQVDEYVLATDVIRSLQIYSDFLSAPIG